MLLKQTIRQNSMPNQRSLILVDDSLIEGMLVEESVEVSETFTVFRHVVDSRQATSVIVAEKPDVVLLDLRMPGLSGWEVLTQLRKANILAATFVAILSNSNSPSDRSEAQVRGAHSYFVKPMDSRGYGDIIDAVAKQIGAK